MAKARVKYKTNPFQKATKERSKLRMAIDGPSGSGKTFTALIFATALANGGRVAVVDTERGSASKYADMFEFDVLELSEYAPERYIAGITAAEKAGYDVIVIDSLSHAWEGKGGILEMHDDATRRSRSKNSYIAWRDVTPKHRSLIDAMLQSPCHIIATMRTKTAYVQSKDSSGKTVIDKVGMAPIQRAGMEYEFDIVADMDLGHTMVIGKSRCFSVTDDVVSKPTAEWFEKVRAWLTTGAEPQEKREPEMETTEAEAPKKANGDPPRPWKPDVLKRKMLKAAETKALSDRYGGEPSQEQIGLLAGKLEEAWAGDKGAKQNRYEVLGWLTGRRSTRDLNLPWVATLLKWLLKGKDEAGNYEFNEHAREEARLVYKQAMLDQGQQELPTGATPHEDMNGHVYGEAERGIRAHEAHKTPDQGQEKAQFDAAPQEQLDGLGFGKGEHDA